MTTDEPSILQTEPITIVESIKAVLLSTLALLQVFGIWTLTDAQQAVIVAEYVAVSVALSAFARSAVTPTARVALTKSDAALITESQKGA